jgi:hypothetical protein
VALGITVMLVAPVTVPTPPSMLRLVALLVVHERTEVAPEVMVDGVAIKLEMDGARTTLTANLAVDTVPVELVAVNV